MTSRFSSLIHRNPVPLFYIHTSRTYNNFNAAYKKTNPKVKSWRFTLMGDACFKVTDKHLEIFTHARSLLHRVGGRVASFSRTLTELGWMGRNSVTIEKGTSNTQCIYKQKNPKHRHNVTAGSTTKSKNCKRPLKKKTSKPKVTFIQIRPKTKNQQKVFLVITKQYLEMQIQHLDWLCQQRAIPHTEQHDMSQYLPSCPLHDNRRETLIG